MRVFLYGLCLLNNTSLNRMALMKLILESDQRLMHRIANETIEACAATLTDPKVIKALGSYADTCLSLLNNVYVPNRCDDGVYEAPYRYRDGESIPYILGLPGEEVTIDLKNMFTMHPQQIETLDSFLHGVHGYSLDDDEFFSRVYEIEDYQVDGKPYTTEEIEICSATVPSVWGLLHEPDAPYIGLAKHRWVRRRPYILQDASMDNDDGQTLLHELVHVNQHLTELPCNMANTRKDYLPTRKELEAFYVEDLALRALHGTNPYWYVANVEALRQQVNQDNIDPFAVTPELLREMEKRNYDNRFAFKDETLYVV